MMFQNRIGRFFDPPPDDGGETFEAAEPWLDSAQRDEVFNAKIEPLCRAAVDAAKVLTREWRTRTHHDADSPVVAALRRLVDIQMELLVHFAKARVQ